MTDRVPRAFWRAVRGALAGAEYDYTKGSLRRAALLLAVPMVLEMSLESVFALVDIWWVNQLDEGLFDAVSTDGAAVTAVGATESLLTIVYAFAIGFGMAVTAMVARRVGEQDLPGAATAGAQAIGLGVAFGALTGVPAAIFAPELLALVTDNDRVVEAGTGYARWVLGGNVIVTLLFLQNAIFRGAGDPMLALKTLAVANGLNLILDPCLIFGLGPFPALGVTGAGVATCTGRAVAVGYQMWILSRGQGRVRLDRAIRFDPPAMWQLCRLSFGTVGQFLIATSSWVFVMGFVNQHGEHAAAGYTTGIRILMFALLPAWGLSNAAATLVGQNLGAGQPDRAERSVWLIGWYDMLFLAVVTVVMVAFPEPIIAAFTSNPVVAQHAVDSLRIISAGYVFYAWGMVTVQAFNGAGDTVTPTWLNFVFFWLLELPVAWWFGEHHGLPGICWSITIAESLFAVAGVLLFRRGRWKTRTV